MKKLYPDSPSGFILIVAGLFLVIAVGYTVGLATPVAAQQIDDPTETTIEGAVFPLPESLEDEVKEYRQQVPQRLPEHVSVVATTDELYLVFSESKPQTGKATVTGPSLERGISAKGLQFGIIKADSISVDTTGERTTIEEVKNNPEEYELELVQIRSHHRRISFLNDPDQGENFTAPVSAGLLTENPTTANGLFANSTTKSRGMTVNTSSDDIGSDTEEEIDSLLGSQEPQLFAFDLTTDYWSDTDETVDGIVLQPGSRALEFAKTFDSTGILESQSSESTLYVVKTDRSSQEYSSVQSLKQNANDGDVVTIESNLYGQTVSTQESLEENTGCGESQAQVPSPSGPVCVDVLQDVVIDAGAAWTSTPDSKEDVLFVAGLSSQHLDEMSTDLQGRYRLTGEIVHTSRFDRSLPDGQILVIYDIEKTGELTFESLPTEQKETISQKGEKIKNIFNELDKTPHLKSSAVDHNWKSKRYDDKNTGYNPFIDGPSADNSINWSFSPQIESNWSISTAPIVTDDQILFGTVVGDWEGGYVYSIDRETGTLNWKTEPEGAVSSAPTVENDVVYVTTDINEGKGYVYALDVDSGSQKWKYTTQNIGVPGSVTVKNEVVYFGDLDSIRALDANTGQLIWENRFSYFGGIFNKPAVDNGVVYTTVAHENEGLVAVDAKTGTELWRTNISTSIWSSPVVGKDSVYTVASNATNDTGKLYSFNKRTGTIEWVVRNKVIENTPVLANGTIYTGSPSGRVYAVDSSDGTVQWTKSYEAGGTPIVANNTLYVGSADKILALQRDTGKVKWERDIKRSYSFYFDKRITVSHNQLYYNNYEEVVAISGSSQTTASAESMESDNEAQSSTENGNIERTASANDDDHFSYLIPMIIGVLFLLGMATFAWRTVAVFSIVREKFNILTLWAAASKRLSTFNTEVTSVDFVISFSCGNCGNNWERPFNQGDTIRETESGVTVYLENKDKEGNLLCPVCDTHHAVTIEDREPTE